MNYIANNTDATFRKRSRKAKPSALLLHYKYGATALFLWGQNVEALTERENIPRPAPIKSDNLGHARTRSEHEKLQKKLTDSREAERESKGKKSDQRSEREALVHDTMIFLWGNTPAATERRAKAERQRKEMITSWRSSVTN